MDRRGTGSKPTWKSPVTRRNALSIVMAAFNLAVEEFALQNPLVGMEKPPQRPRLLSFTPEDDELLYSATDKCFGEFLFACIHTGLRPYCELAKMTIANVFRNRTWHDVAGGIEQDRSETSHTSSRLGR
ncbi:MAG TPA: hypothetical protein DD473_10815 [Planctomycetaceae bacterium]|nr:hypothetical protein [Planctomycetaceae bacterium]